MPNSEGVIGVTLNKEYVFMCNSCSQLNKSTNKLFIIIWASFWKQKLNIRCWLKPHLHQPVLGIFPFPLTSKLLLQLLHYAFWPVGATKISLNKRQHILVCLSSQTSATRPNSPTVHSSHQSRHTRRHIQDRADLKVPTDLDLWLYFTELLRERGRTLDVGRGLQVVPLASCY